MLINHLLTFVRNLSRNRTYAFINILGLAIGFASTLIISIYVMQEFTYDKFHKDYNRIYRLSANSFAFTSVAHLNYLEQQLSGIDAWVEVIPTPGSTIKYKGISYLEEQTYFTTDKYFEVFEQDLYLGDSESALESPNSVILTKSIAAKIFGSNNPIGESIELTTRNEVAPYTVTGIIDDSRTNTHLKFEVLARLPQDTYEYYKNEFRYTIGHGYFKLEAQPDELMLSNQVEEIFAKRRHKLYGGNQSFEEFFSENQRSQFLVMNIADVHLNSNLQFEASPPGKIEYLYMFIGIAIFIILLAAINYVNLATAQASKRAKEIGVRKVMGSVNRNLVIGLISESMLLTMVSFLVGLFIGEIFLELLQSFGFSNFNIDVLSNPNYNLVLGLFLVSILTGILAGIYPAFYLVGFNPIAVLRGNYRVGTRNKNFRSTLVIFQFVVSLTLSIFTIFIYQQMNYSLSKDIGFDKENVIVLDNSKSYLEENSAAFENELKAIPDVNSVSFSHFSMIDRLSLSALKAKEDEELNVRMSYKYIDDQFLNTMGFTLVEGRNFVDGLESDSNAIIVNKRMATLLGGDVLNKRYDANFNGTDVKIVGIVDDFHFQDFSHEIGPVVFFNRNFDTQVNIRISGQNTQETVAAINRVWSQFTEEPMDYYFFDQSFNKLFESEQTLGRIVTIFTGLSIFIAFLGLIGLISYQLDQRTKEIGIRKVLGASISQILSLFSKEFASLVLIAILITIPISILISSRWLENFVYHIDIKVFPFLIVACFGLLTTIIIVSIRTIKSASANPVSTLRNE
jgi:putative ABC transport system permease protein